MRGFLFTAAVAVLSIAFYFLFVSPESISVNPSAVNRTVDGSQPSVTNTNASPRIGSFREVRTPTWASSTPRNNAVARGFPVAITVRFYQPIVPGSTLIVEREGTPVDSVPAAISADGLSLFTPFPQHAGPGLFTVRFRACTAVEVCTDGSFGFTVL